MSTAPWTDGDPQPGDFDADLASLEPRCAEHREGDPDAKLVVAGASTEEAASLPPPRSTLLQSWWWLR
jgi:hypothetical protein